MTGIDDVLVAVAEHFGFTVEALTGDSRTDSRLSQARHIAMYLCREFTDLSLPKIGEAFSREYLAVMYAEYSVRELMEWNSGVAEDVQAISQRLSG